MRTAPRRSLLSVGVLAAALTLSACSGSSDPVGDAAKAQASAAKAAPAPVSALPSPIASLVTKTDVGEFFVTPKAGTPKKEIDGAIARLKGLPGVQSADLKPDGTVDVVFRGTITTPQRETAVKQLAALGDVQEGI